MKGAALPVSSADDWEALETRTATRSRGERPEQASSILPVWLSFFFFGVVNNFAYVVFLSAAEAMVERHAGAVLFADVVPGLLLKTSVGWWLHRVRYAVRVYGVSVGNFAAFVVAAAMASVASTTLSVAAMLAAVACVSLMGALGEATFLALTARYGQPALAAWSSGTGFAGIAGAGLYALLTNVLGVRPSRTLMLLAPVPLLMGVTYAAARLPADAPAASEGLRSDADAPNTQRKWSMVYRLIPRYLAPLLVVYWAEYTINQGLLPTTDVNDWIQPSATRDAGAPIRHARYAMLQLVYQTAVFVSRSSIACFRVRALWALTLLQCNNVAVLTVLSTQPPVQRTLWLYRMRAVVAVVFFEGLLGGATYANTFAAIREAVPPPLREWTLGVSSVADAMGIAAASVVSLWVECAVFRRHGWECGAGRR
ncbi:hypothetical protein CDCA_CDCA11G3268 [Cyanidium caldarium]|uniref:Protein BTN n=1 Tax=Cyanidium caldarium TaxID=2771 RepID=A0AAV9IZM3_CYACA|nr:hypothetical protein CDCA_CDCA11G3268 [Cyanidium caldarium]